MLNGSIVRCGFLWKLIQAHENCKIIRLKLSIVSNKEESSFYLERIVVEKAIDCSGVGKIFVYKFIRTSDLSMKIPNFITVRTIYYKI